MNPEQPRSLRRWRSEQRNALLERRTRIEKPHRKAMDAAIRPVLCRVLRDSGARVVSLYWPFKGEFNTRDLMRELYADGLCVALPVVVAARAPLEFRAWEPDATMTHGVYGIPVPQDGAPVIPEAVVAPLVGFDGGGYRLGYGGGYYDRTLAALTGNPLVVGVGYELSRLDTIYPQHHDRPMDCVITEAGRHDYRAACASPAVDTLQDKPRHMRTPS